MEFGRSWPTQRASLISNHKKAISAVFLETFNSRFSSHMIDRRNQYATSDRENVS